MPFGLTNAPAAFQRFMNKVFGDLLDICIVIYLDNILIYSDDLTNYKDHVKEVLKRLWDNGLYASPSKCAFHQHQVEFLGFVLSPEGVQMDTKKIQTIQDWPIPRCIRDVQAFLGFANFYRRFIKGYSELTSPLTKLTRKNEPWVWSLSCQMSFETLKSVFISVPILVHWNPDALMIVETNASDHALVAILSTQVNRDIHPAAFHSHTFNATESNYDVHDKKLLAIFEAFKKWRHYLEGTPSPVEVFTDHKNLVYFCKSKTLSCRQARWSEFLS